MGVKNEQKIPILKPSGFSERYFRHGRTEAVAAKQVHFDIQNRYIVKNQIPAHRINFFMIFLVTSGEGIQSLGSSDYYLCKNSLCFIGPNVINSWQAQTDEHQGYSISFTDDYFNEGLINRQHQRTKAPLSSLGWFKIVASWSCDNEFNQRSNLVYCLTPIS